MIAKHVLRTTALVASSLATMSIVGGARAQAVIEQGEFRAMLRDAGVAEEDFAEFERWEGKLSEPQAGVVARLLFRLQRLERIEAAQPQRGSDDSSSPGSLIHLQGVAHSHSPIELPALASAAIDRPELLLTIVRRSRGERIAVLSKDAPLAWSGRGAQLDEPMACVAVVLGSMEIDGEGVPLVLASRVEWRPTSNVTVGTAWLVERGFDAALFDDVRHGQGFAKSSESREAQAFYECLSIMAGSTGLEISGVVRRALPELAQQSEIEVAEAKRKLEALSSTWQAFDSAARAKLSRELQTVRRQQAVATGIVEQAKRGASSVVPLFLEPERHTGEAVLFEGTVRRAIRIAVDDEVGGPGTSPIKEYYELDLFTKDSQHLPIICCVPELPQGFPTGEVIREPVRVAGIFFKKWAYARRTTDEPATQSRRLPERLQSPLIIAAMPERIAQAEPSPEGARGLLAGLGFVATLLVIWLLVASSSRRDRMARARQARYDSRLDTVAEP